MSKRDKNAPAASGGAPVRRETYNGHEIVIPLDEKRKKVFIDGRPAHWGETGGTYYLDVYAYDRGRSLDETIKRYLDYRDKTTLRTRKEAK
jgi:hypothetical protein